VSPLLLFFSLFLFPFATGIAISFQHALFHASSHDARAHAKAKTVLAS